MKDAIRTAIKAALPPETDTLEVVVQDVPAGKPGDYGVPVFPFAKALRQAPPAIAAQLAARVVLPSGIAKVEAVGGYLNFFVDAARFVQNTVETRHSTQANNTKVVIEHTSVNPNKEWHIGHVRGALIGDTLGRIHRALGYEVEIQNYIDDTGRQAAESLFAARHYRGENWREAYNLERAQWSKDDWRGKLDHWLGALYVQLHKEFDDTATGKTTKEQHEPEIATVIHQLERGELRDDVERIVRAHLETAHSLDITYDLLVWESDIVRAGFVDKALDILLQSPHLVRPTEGKFAGTVCIDLSDFVPGLEEPLSVLVRSNGTTMYACKDIAFHYWKFGLFEGLGFSAFETQNEHTLYTSSPDGVAHPGGKHFAHAQIVINPIDARQSLAQTIVKAGLAITESGSVAAKNHHHLGFETVLLEGKTMSGRKGIVVSADEVIREAQTRAAAVVAEKNPGLENADAVARAVGVGALKFAFLKSEPGRQIDFRFEQALALSGDTAPVVQYAHARARSIERKGAQHAHGTPDWSQVGPLELDLALVIAKFKETLELCVRDHSPHPMCAYALELATAFNGYYNHKDKDGKSDTNVLESPAGLREARLALVVRVADALRDALGVLGIEAPNEM